MIAAIVFAMAGHAQAKNAFVPNAIAVSGSAFSFDLSGVGTTPAFAVTADWPLTNHLLVEGGATFAWPNQQGLLGRTTYFIPEAQLQYSWQFGRFMPFAGGGIGAGIDFRDELFGGAKVDLALSTGGGARIAITDTFGVRGELRLRGLGRDFGASTGEFRGGLFWRF
jgi:hypothetical protein